MNLRVTQIMICALLVTEAPFSTFAAGAITSSSALPRTAASPSSSSGSSVPVSPGSQGAAQLGEVIVTATRRQEPLQRVPVSVKALTGKDLADADIKNIADIAAVTPGLEYTASGWSLLSNITQISIRGVSSLFGASTVGLYIDDTPIQGRLSPLGNVGSPYPVVFDLNRVEVDRGPQGTLFGAGAEGGTVRFILNQPSLTQFSGFSNAEYDWTEDGDPSYQISAAGGGPLVENRLGFRVGAYDRHDGGYINLIDPQGNVADKNANTDDKRVLRLAFAVSPINGLLVTPSVFYQLVTIGNSGLFYGEFSDPNAGIFDSGKLRPDHSVEHFVVSSVNVQADLSFAKLTSTSSYMYRNLNEQLDLSTLLGAIGIASYGNPLGPAYASSEADVAPTYTGQMIKAYTQEIRLASNDSGSLLRWVTGLFFDHRSFTDYQNTYSLLADPTGGNILEFHQVITDKQLAAFAQVDARLSRKLTATVGVRVARVTSDLYEANGTINLNAGQPPVSKGSSTSTPVTPKIGLSYQVDPNDMLYISAGKGFRAGGVNTGLPTYCNTTPPNGFSPDTVWSYEIGAKDRVLNGRLQIDSSLYRINWSQIQQVVLLSCGLSYATNAGHAFSKGFDFAAQAVVTDRLRINLDIGYTNARYTENVYNDVGQPLVLSGDAVGFMPFMISPWNVSASATYEIPLPRENRIAIRAEYQYDSRNQGPFISQVPNSPAYFPLEVPDPPTHMTNVRLSYIHDPLNLTVFVNNVFNSHPYLSSYQDTPTSNLLTYATFRPRTVGISLDYEF